MEVYDFARQLLFGETLEDKLHMPPSFSRQKPWREVIQPQAPGRCEKLQFKTKKNGQFKIVRNRLRIPIERARLLHSFANHELLAIELMALCLLKFPDAPVSLQNSLLNIIGEEQQHFQLYRQRIRELGMDFGDISSNDFFWRILSPIDSLDGFIAAMSLTIEQANLDYCAHFHDIFLEIEDESTAAIIKQVYNDEIKHVRHGVRWLKNQYPDQKLWNVHRKCLGDFWCVSRSKGKQFNRQGRKLAGLNDDYIDSLEVFTTPISRAPNVYFYNPDCELAMEHSGIYRPSKFTSQAIDDFSGIQVFLLGTQEADIVVTPRQPTTTYLRTLKNLGFPLCQYKTLDAIQDLPKGSQLRPWSWTPQMRTLASKWSLGTESSDEIEKRVFDKRLLPSLREKLRLNASLISSFMLPDWVDGELLDSVESVLEYSRRIYSRYRLPVVVKAPYSAAGRSRIRITDGNFTNQTHKKWLGLRLQSMGNLLVEPWLPRIQDISWVSHPHNPQGGKGGLTSFLTTESGQYSGHFLGRGDKLWSQDIREFFYKRQLHGALWEEMAGIENLVRDWLLQEQYSGPFGIDMFVGCLEDRYFIYPVAEVNARMTMGHVAKGLSRQIAKGAPAVWLPLRKSIVHQHGFENFSRFAEYIHDSMPLVWEDQVIKSGAFFTNDTALAYECVGVVGVGNHAVNDLFKMQKGDRQ